MRTALFLCLLALTAGCASPGPAGHAGEGEMPVWRLADLAGASQPVILLRSPSGATLRMDTARAKLIQATAGKVAAAAGEGETPDWLLVGTSSVNAFATYQNGKPVIGITLGMVGVLKDDEGAWGALIGHELAHFRLGQREARRSRQEALRLGSTLAGLVLSVAGVSFGGTAADAAGTLVERSFSRDDERDADRLGLDYARRAGLDPKGALRLQERLRELKEDAVFGFLSTHPSSGERLESIRGLLDAPVPAGGSAPSVPAGAR